MKNKEFGLGLESISDVLDSLSKATKMVEEKKEEVSSIFKRLIEDLETCMGHNHVSQIYAMSLLMKNMLTIIAEDNVEVAGLLSQTFALDMASFYEKTFNIDSGSETGERVIQ